MAYKQLTKAPGEHSAWHKNTGGLSILITEGKGYYQERGQEARLLHASDIVEAGANIEHWIGAAPGCPMSYAVIGNPGETQETEALKEADYHAAVAESLKPLSSNTLSAREHAIVLIGASTGYGDYIALREALKAALEEGMTQNELKEILAQAYAYCGFPRAIRATQVLMGLIEERKSQGIDDPAGSDSVDVKAPQPKYRCGQEVLEKLTGVAPAEKPTGFNAFSPALDRFLMEHLFCDIFTRGVVSFKERELATVSFIVGVGHGVESMAKAHIGICLHLGWTREQIGSLLNDVSVLLGEKQVKAIRKLY